MTSQPLPQPQEITPLTQRKLEPSALDWRSTKVLMFLGVLLICASVAATTFNTLAGGFLLDDLLHVDYCHQALHGNPGPFLQNFTGNWGGSDLMKSYRPLVSCSIFLDYLGWGSNPWGYHLTNLLLYALTAVMVSLTTLELTGLTGNKNKALTAVWAGLLFTVYPLHAESVAWIIGRVDLLATFFYVTSLFTYLRYRLIHEKTYFLLSLLAFLSALVSKEIAITLPLAIFTLALIAGSPGQNISQKFLAAIKESLPYLLLLALFAILRTLILGTAIGGYSNENPDLNLLKALSVFTDKESLAHILSPLSQEYAPLKKWFPLSLSLFTAPFLLYLLGSLSYCKRTTRAFAPGFCQLVLLLFLAFATLLPAFQIWHIYPNLVGSRLFYLSSVFVSISLALAALEHRNLSGKLLAFFTGAGTISLALLYVLWAAYLGTNLKNFQTAGALMKNAGLQLTALARSEKASAAHPIYLTSLPQDYKGAGLIGRRQYLDILLKQPFCKEDLRRNFVILEEKPNGLPPLMSKEAHQFLLNAPSQLPLFAPAKEGTSLFRRLSPGQTSDQTYPKNFLFQEDSLHSEQTQALVRLNKAWHFGKGEEAQVIKLGQPTLLLSNEGGTIYNAQNTQLELLAKKPLSLKTKLGCDLEITLASEFQEVPLSLIILLSDRQTSDYLELTGEKQGNKIHFPLSHLRDYVLSQSPEHSLSLKFPKSGDIILKEIAFTPSKDL